MRIFRRRKNEYLKFIPFFALAIFSLAFFASAKLQASAADVSGNLTITEAHAYKDDAETVELSSTSGISPGSTSYFKIKFKWKYESSTPLVSGDTVTFPLANNSASATSRNVNIPNMAPQAIIDQNGEKIGEWKIASRKGVITFSNAAVGKTSIEGELTTPRNVTIGGIWRDDMVVPVTVGNVTLQILVPGSPTIGSASDDPVKTTSNRSNNSTVWGFYSPGITINELYRGEGRVALSSNARISNLIVEDPLDENVTSIDMTNINARVTLPRNWTDGSLGAASFGLEANMKSLFTEKQQADGQSYEEYKASLNELEWGTYRDPDTRRLTLVMNLGSQPSSKTYSDALRAQNSSYATMGAMANAAYPFATTDIGGVIDRITGSDNIVGGAVVFYAISFRVNYPQASIETPLSNTATFSWDTADGEHKVMQKTVNSALVVGKASSEVKGEAKLYLRDAATKLPIAGVNLKLQVQNGTVWEDVAGAAKTTGDDGSIQILSLEPGAKYRWVQTSFADHYLTNSFKLYSDEAMNTVITDFTMPNDAGVTTYATNEKESFTITYKAGAHGNFSDIVFNKQYYGSTTPQPTTAQIIPVTGWTFTGWSPSVSNIVTGEATYTAQWQRQTKSESVSIIWDDSDNPNDTRPNDVKIQLLQNGNNYGSETTITEDNHWANTWSNLPAYSDDGTTQYTYTVENKTNVPGYTATVSTASNGTHIVTFKIKQATVTTYHYLKNTTTEVADTENQTLDYGAPYTTGKKTLNNYNYDSVSGRPSGDVGESDITVKYFYTHKTGTLTVHHYQVGTTTEVSADEIMAKNYGEDYSTSYINNLPNHIYDSTVGTPSGTFAGDTVVTYYYKLKTATITTHYYIKDTTDEIAPDVVETKNYTEDYETHPLTTIPTQYQDYELVSSQPTDYKGTVNKSPIVVTYYYQKKDVKLSSNLKLTAPESINSKTAAVKYNVNYAVDIKDFIGNINTIITMKLPYPIDEEKSELDGGAYDRKTKTITWTKAQQYNTYNDGEDITIAHEVSLIYDGAQAKDQLLATAEATIQLESKSNDAADSVETAIKTPSKLIFRFVDQDGKVIQEEHEEEGFVGYESKFRPVEIPGYKLVTEENMDYLFGEEQKTITYHYVRLVNPNTGNEEIYPYFIIVGALASTLCYASVVLVKRKI